MEKHLHKLLRFMFFLMCFIVNSFMLLKNVTQMSENFMQSLSTTLKGVVCKYNF